MLDPWQWICGGTREKTMSDTVSKLETPSPLHLAPDSRNIMTAAKGGGITFIGDLFEYAGRFVFGIVVARFVGAEQYGVYYLALTPLTILTTLALLGLKASMVRYVPIFARQRNEEGLWGTLQVGLGLTMMASVVLGGALLILADPVANRMFHSPELAPFLRIAGFTVPFAALMEIIGSATQGFKQMQYRVYAQDISVTSIKLILAVILLAMGFGTLGVMAAHTLAIISAFIMLLYFLHKLFPLNRSMAAAQRDAKQMLGFSLPVYFSQVIDVLGGSLGILLLGMLNTTTSVGIFAAAARVSVVGKLFHSSIVVVSQPIVSDLYSKGDRDQLKHFYQVMTKWTFAFNFPLFLIIVIFSGPILSIFGDSFIAGSAGLVILAFGFLIDAGTGICGVVINMTGHTWLNIINSILVVAITLALNILLIPGLGVIGAAIAAGVATTILNLSRLLEVFKLFRLWPYNVEFIKPILAGVTAMAVTLVIKQWVLIGTSLIYLALGATCLLLTYVIMILVLGLSQEDHMILKRLHSRLKAVL